jgi:DNA-binding NarL/FixJ family response regulator
VTLSVLIVDDSAELVDVLGFYIENDPRFETVGSAGTGDEAVQVASQVHPDVIVLDQMMPKVSGEEALPQLRALCPDATIVLYTAAATPALAVRTMEHADVCLGKEASLAGLLDLIVDVRDKRPH